MTPLLRTLVWRYHPQMAACPRPTMTCPFDLTRLPRSLETLCIAFGYSLASFATFLYADVNAHTVTLLPSTLTSLTLSIEGELDVDCAKRLETMRWPPRLRRLRLWLASSRDEWDDILTQPISPQDAQLIRAYRLWLAQMQRVHVSTNCSYTNQLLNAAAAANAAK